MMEWIPIEKKLPQVDEYGCSTYILVSFENFSLPDIARYQIDKDDGAFYPGDEEKSYVSYGLFVNAWMPLPECYKKEGEG